MLVSIKSRLFDISGIHEHCIPRDAQSYLASACWWLASTISTLWNYLLCLMPLFIAFAIVTCYSSLNSSAPSAISFLKMFSSLWTVITPLSEYFRSKRTCECFPLQWLRIFEKEVAAIIAYACIPPTGIGIL